MRISVRRTGNSAGIILPKPVLTELGVKAGDNLSLTLETGGVVPTPVRRIRGPAGRRHPLPSPPVVTTGSSGQSSATPVTMNRYGKAPASGWSSAR
jgi:hypothetical protein